MVEIAHTFLFEFVRRGESDRSREENFRERVSGVQASERVETSWLSESKTDFIVLGPYGFEHGNATSHPHLAAYTFGGREKKGANGGGPEYRRVARAGAGRRGTSSHSPCCTGEKPVSGGG